MTPFKPLTERIIAAGQIMSEDVARARDEGVTLIVNNRPDGEAEGQPEGAEIERAAREAGIDYLAIPVGASGFSLPQVERLGEALENTDGKVLAFCRTGTRSTLLWALSEAKRGRDVEDVAREAAHAGYDVAPVRPTMDMFASQHG